MSARDYTDIGGAACSFGTTQWTLIDKIDDQESPSNQAMVNDLTEMYWKPVYCYLRKKGHDNEHAKDITQGFFQDIVLGRCLLNKADHNKGRFRTLLLTALDRYATSLHRKETSQKRAPQNRIIPLDDIVASEIPDDIRGSEESESFNYAWLSGILDRALEQLQMQCESEGLIVHWHLFCDRVLSPLLEDKQPPTMKELCKKYDIEKPVKASNMIVTVKRRFQSILKRQLRQSVTSDAQLNIELDDLIKLSEKSGAI